MAHTEAVIHIPPSTVAKLVDQVVDKVLKELHVQKPSLGRIVLTHVDPAQNNGSHVAPAIITRVWSDTTVNLRVLLDAFTMPLSLTSVHLFETEADAEGYAGTPAFWPPRV